MLGFRKKSFDQAWTLLRAIAQPDLDALDILKLQVLLVEEIRHAEGKIRQYKAELKTLKKDTTRFRWVSGRIKAYQKLNFVWRSFGDGIAFLFLDKYTIKQAFYSTRTTSAKQSAGFLSDKVGFDAEFKALVTALSQGVPCVLADLTNSIRYGDICLMSEDEPQFVEIKSGRRTDHRGRRQRDDIAKLHNFFATDRACDLRGFKEVRRVEHSGNEVTHEAAMNECIAAAQSAGHAVANPEPGTYYLALYDNTNLDELMQAWVIERGETFYLNSYKSNSEWAPYRPFTLSIHDKDALYDFITGNLILIVMYDKERFRKYAERPGLTVTISDDLGIPIQYQLDGEEGYGGVSQHFLSRIGMEFLSARWVCDQMISASDRARKKLEQEASSTP